MSKFSVTLWTVACEASLSRGSPGENARASSHTLLEHHISCFPSLQGAWVPGAARPLWPKQLQHLHTRPSLGHTQVLQGGLRSKPRWLIHMQRWRQNQTWNPGAMWLRTRTQNLPTNCTSCGLNPHNQLSRLCVCGLYKRTLRAHKRKCTSSDSCGRWRQEHAGVGPDQSLSCLHSRSRDHWSVGGHPR